MISLYNDDCLNTINEMISNNVRVDLIVTDPPYLIENTTSGSKNKFGKRLQSMNDELLEFDSIIDGIDNIFLEKLILLQDKVNIYIWCNHKQIIQYLNFFVVKNNCKFDVLLWNKTNSPPTFNNKYLTDKEYCLYFRKGGYCQPINYISAKTVFTQPINSKDKQKYIHPTIKPLNIIRTLILNSSKENDIIFDPFMGSGTTGVACIETNRKFIGCELEQKYFEIAKGRIQETKYKQSDINNLF